MWTSWIEKILATHTHKRVHSSAETTNNNTTHTQSDHETNDVTSDATQPTTQPENSSAQLPKQEQGLEVIDSASESEGDSLDKTAEVSAKVFLGLFGLVGSMLIRNLTVKSAKSFGSFHLLRLLLDEYLTYLVERDESLPTAVSPLIAWPNNGTDTGTPLPLQQHKGSGQRPSLHTHLQNTQQQQQQQQQHHQQHTQQRSIAHPRTHPHAHVGGIAAHARAQPHVHMRGYENGAVDYRTGLALGSKGVKRDIPVKLIPRPMVFPNQHKHIRGTQNQLIQPQPHPKPQPVVGIARDDGSRRQPINEELEPTAHLTKRQKGDRAPGPQKNNKQPVQRTIPPTQSQSLSKQHDQAHNTTHKNAKHTPIAPVAGVQNGVRRPPHDGVDHHPQSQHPHPHPHPHPRAKHSEAEERRRIEQGHALAQNPPRHETYTPSHSTHHTQPPQRHMQRTYSAASTDNNGNRTKDTLCRTNTHGGHMNDSDDDGRRNHSRDREDVGANGNYGQAQLRQPQVQYTEDEYETRMRGNDGHVSHADRGYARGGSPEATAYKSLSQTNHGKTRSSQELHREDGLEDMHTNPNTHGYRESSHMYDDIARNDMVGYDSRPQNHLDTVSTLGDLESNHDNHETHYATKWTYSRDSDILYEQNMHAYPDTASNDHYTGRVNAHGDESGDNMWNGVDHTLDQRRDSGDFTGDKFRTKASNGNADIYSDTNDHFRQASTVSSGTNVVSHLN